MTDQTPPRWDLSNVFPGLDSAEFAAAITRLHQLIAAQEDLLAQAVQLDAGADPAALAARLQALLISIQEISLLASTTQAYIYSFVTTDSFNTEARRKLSEFDQFEVALNKQESRFREWVGKIAPRLDQLTAQPGILHEHAFWLNEVADQSRYLMSQPEESLAAELNVSGASAWQKLQGTLTSQLSVDFELDGQVQKMSMPALINLRSHPDPDVRRRAYEAESAAWESVREPLAAAMNGIKGTVNVLNQRRGRQDALHASLDINRIDRQTLEAMLEAMRESFPMFRRYFQAKAARLGKAKLPWYDLFAPVGKTSQTYTYPQAREFILEHFNSFSPELAGFARQAFDKNWIDAEQRNGKRGGAFCMGVPGVKESRILLNFDGSLDVVSTLAHELGHGFHNYCMFKAGRTELQRTSPMTMNETASIMCETIAVNAALAQAAGPDEELAILETSLIGDGQVVVDIYSRYLFESEVFERRAQSELSADDLCEMMERAQKAAYGDGLDENYLQKYMWTWKPHYYSAELSFYNFPYTFGLLFGTGLYAIYQQRGAAFVPEYEQLLASTGMASAADLAARFAIDIRTPEFWRSSLGIIGQRVERYVSLK